MYKMGMFWVISFFVLYAFCLLVDRWMHRRRVEERRERTAAERALDLIAADYEPRRGPEREMKKKKAR